jgi:hypothetical protein
MKAARDQSVHHIMLDVWKPEAAGLVNAVCADCLISSAMQQPQARRERSDSRIRFGIQK